MISLRFASGFAVVLLGCDGLLVGGECLEGFIERSGACIQVAEPIGGGAGAGQGGAGSGGVDSVGAGGSGGTPVVSIGAGGKPQGAQSSGSGSNCAPLVACGDRCVDTQIDPLHCGECDFVCPSGLCESGECVGAPIGHVALLGFNYANVATGSQEAHVLGNGVFLSSMNPVRLLTIEPATHAGLSGHLTALVMNEAQSRGRDVDVAQTSPASLRSHFDAADFDVLLIAGDGFGSTGLASATAETLRDAWKPLFDRGGVVIGTASESAAPRLEAFVNTSEIIGEIIVASELPSSFVVNAPTDALALGLISPFGPAAASQSFTVEAEQAIRVIATASGSNTVVHIATP
jgi:hypothetical protein